MLVEVAAVTTPEQLWTRFLEVDCAKLSRHVLDTWLRPIRCVAVESGTIVLEVQDQFFRDWLSDHYLDFIQESLSKHTGERVSIAWRINEALKREAERQAAQEVVVNDAPPLAPAEIIQTAEVAPDAAAEEALIASLPTVGDRTRGSNQLNARFIFDTFVAGPSNEFAYAACKAVADKPGQSYNPLFLFGGVGLGKTHLISAIGQHILKTHDHARIVYVSAEQFTNDVVNAVLSSKLEEFRDKYRRHCDAILIDDIQLIAGKERTQHEFFHIFNALYESQRQIVVTSDKLPHEIPDIEERLRNRFQWGLIADIQPPEMETRVAILRKKAVLENVHLSDDVTFFLAESIRSNVRELEGALVRLLAHASLSQEDITVEYARKVLGSVVELKPASVSMDVIQRVVADFYHVKIADLKSRRRVKNVVVPRQVAMYLCRKHTGASYPDIGARFGKDHTTIISAYDRIHIAVGQDAELRKQISELERKLEVARPA